MSRCCSPQEGKYTNDHPRRSKATWPTFFFSNSLVCKTFIFSLIFFFNLWSYEVRNHTSSAYILCREKKKHSHSEQHLGKTPPSVNLYQKSYVGLISTNPSVHFYVSVSPNIRGKSYSWEEAPARGLFMQMKPVYSARSPPCSPHFQTGETRNLPPPHEEDGRRSELHQTPAFRNKVYKFEKRRRISGREAKPGKWIIVRWQFVTRCAIKKIKCEKKNRFKHSVVI